MSRAETGLLVGMSLGYAGWFGGFTAFLLVAALGAVGWIVGRLVDSGVGPLEYFGPRDGRRDGPGDDSVSGRLP
ncbi:hypothetical protein [Streptomyces sp. AK02-04a]|uniref:hypothetical protein n=1 Tax=Streptomyces sp. AK02-04a TaxID=3028649 RepID=UPI0029A77B8C|nr:hypothetical protein [Streptomyces sp. AK02-04a]MDX3763400.1 hypothetical protein [Streptomyces sp. AK02-04a]